MKAITSTLTGLALCVGLAASAELPKGWFPAGSHPKDYEMKLDQDITHNGKGSLSVKSIVPNTSGFGTLMQMFKADDYRGKRLRMSGYVRSTEVLHWAGLWLRVDGPKREPLAFDNMQDRPITGTGDWKKYEIVLDVPQQADKIAFGLLLTGQGQAWMDDLNFEAVGTDVPTTATKPVPDIPSAPRNLDFEE